MTIADELQKLELLRQSGAIDDEEFHRAKAKLFEVPAVESPLTPIDSVAKSHEVNQWAMFVHLSLLGGFVVPFAGFVLPFVLWQIKKDQWPEIDAHGKVVVNWLISKIIYAAVLVLSIIGIPLLIVLGVLAIIFPIIGGMKADKGEVWRYPLSITFLK